MGVPPSAEAPTARAHLDGGARLVGDGELELAATRRQEIARHRSGARRHVPHVDAVQPGVAREGERDVLAPRRLHLAPAVQHQPQPAHRLRQPLLHSVLTFPTSHAAGALHSPYQRPGRVSAAICRVCRSRPRADCRERSRNSAPARGRVQARRRMPSAFMRSRSVDGRTPSSSAAPPGPAMRPAARSSAATMLSRSSARRSDSFRIGCAPVAAGGGRARRRGASPASPRPGAARADQAARARARSGGVGDRITARSITCCSSRTLPGQS